MHLQTETTRSTNLVWVTSESRSGVRVSATDRRMPAWELVGVITSRQSVGDGLGESAPVDAFYQQATGHWECLSDVPPQGSLAAGRACPPLTNSHVVRLGCSVVCVCVHACVAGCWVLFRQPVVWCTDFLCPPPRGCCCVSPSFAARVQTCGWQRAGCRCPLALGQPALARSGSQAAGLCTQRELARRHLCHCDRWVSGGDVQWHHGACPSQGHEFRAGGGGPVWCVYEEGGGGGGGEVVLLHVPGGPASHLCLLGSPISLLPRLAH